MRFYYYISILLILISSLFCVKAERSDLSVNSDAGMLGVLLAPHNFRYTFLSRSTDGGMSEGGGGLAGADAICNSDFGKPSFGTYKAFIYGPNRAMAGTDWVFKPNTDYRRADGTLIGMSDQSATFMVISSGLCSSSLLEAWTGGDVSFGLASPNNCTSWTDISGGFSGDVGDMSSTDLMKLQNSNYQGVPPGTPYICNSTARYPLCCIEQ